MKSEDKIPPITVQTRKILWGRSGNRCALCKTKSELIEDIGLEGDRSIIGEEAHIVAKSKDGPRGDHELSIELRNNYENLVLLCSRHHKIIDDHPDKYPIEKLVKIKQEHENWVKSNLEIDEFLEKDILIYLNYLKFVEEKMNFTNWQKQCQFIIGHDNVQMKQSMFDNFKDALHFIQNRIWPKRYKELEEAFQSYSKILNDFLRIFNTHSEEVYDGKLETRKFYKISDWNPDKYNKLSHEHDYHNYLLIDLLLELTRIGNHIIYIVRRHISYFYRIDEGVLTVEIGNLITGSTIYRVEYKYENGFCLESYVDLKKFMIERDNRDFTYGENHKDEFYDKYK